MPGKKNFDYDPTPFQGLLRNLLEETGESYREAGLASGLSGTTISNYMRETNPARPMRDACIALSDHFGINPNEMLEAAGYEPLHFFDRRLVDPNALPPDVETIMGKLLDIEDEAVREEMVKSLLEVLRVQMRIRKETIEKALAKARKEAAVHTRATASE